MTWFKKNWQGILVAVLVTAAGMYAGPYAARAMGWAAPKVIEKVSTKTPLAPEPTLAPGGVKVVPPRLWEQSTLSRVARDHGIQGRLDCRVVQR
jgi:hypothetical protein